LYCDTNNIAIFIKHNLKFPPAFMMLQKGLVGLIECV
jgi:hypothetical protein